MTITFHRRETIRGTWNKFGESRYPAHRDFLPAIEAELRLKAREVELLNSTQVLLLQARCGDTVILNIDKRPPQA